MSRQSLTEFEIDALVEEIRSSRKYQTLSLPVETVRSLIEQELPRHKQVKQVMQAVRKKLHNVVAPYLGDPDYQGAKAALRSAHNEGPESVKTICEALLASHASTRERLPILDHFYRQLFQHTGVPERILDLASGLHPLGLPWMGLPESSAYYAFELHKPRVELLNEFFRLQKRHPLAYLQDILVQPPEIEADVAFFFKEAHRFEQRQRGCNRAFWQALKVKHLLVSLPTSSLSGKHDLTEQHRRLVYGATEGLPWQIDEILFESELVFWIRK